MRARSAPPSLNARILSLCFVLLFLLLYTNYQTVNNIIISLYYNVILQENKYNITTEGERTSRAHTGANNKDYHARKTFYVRENSLVGAGDIGPNGLCNA